MKQNVTLAHTAETQKINHAKVGGSVFSLSLTKGGKVIQGGNNEIRTI
jgi:hypothetical protein